MPTRTSELVDLLALERIEVELFRGRHPETMLQRAFGGQVMAQAIMAAYGTVQKGRMMHSMNAYFLRSGSTGSPIIYDVHSMRDGKSFSTRRVVARQGGKSIFELVCSFHVDEPGLDHCYAMPSGVPEPDDCPTLVEVMTKRFGKSAKYFREWEALDVRYIGDSTTDRKLAALDPARMRVWVKTTDRVVNDQRLHQALAAYMSDLTLLSVATIPHKVVFLSPQVQAATINHDMWFHREFKSDEWILFDQSSPSASKALGLSRGRLFQDGKLIGTCIQEGLIRVVDPKSKKGANLRH